MNATFQNALKTFLDLHSEIIGPNIFNCLHTRLRSSDGQWQIDSHQLCKICKSISSGFRLAEQVTEKQNKKHSRFYSQIKNKSISQSFVLFFFSFALRCTSFLTKQKSYPPTQKNKTFYKSDTDSSQVPFDMAEQQRERVIINNKRSSEKNKRGGGDWTRKISSHLKVAPRNFSWWHR